MNYSRTKLVESAVNRSAPKSARVSTALLVLVCFFLGVGVAVWYFRAANRNTAPAAESTGGLGLSASTKAVLDSMASPVEIRFYSLLDPVTTSDSLRAFAERVNQLLSEYDQEAAGKIKVVRQTTRSDTAVSAASADGVKAFNLNRGEVCFLGLAISCDDRKETMSQLSPEWETALEPDLSRAIARVAAPKTVTRSAATSAATVDTAAIAEVKRAIPNLDTVSLEDGTQTLRVAALKEFVAATEAMDQEVKAAEERIRRAQNGGSTSDQQAAVKQLQQVQAEHTEKLKAITARLQDQIAALQELKTK